MTGLLPHRTEPGGADAPVRPARGPTFVLTPRDPSPRRGMRWWIRRLALLALLLTLVGLIVWWAAGPPLTLDSAVLRGARQVQGPICVETYVDWSASMDQHQSERRDALDALNRFAKRELEPTDVYTEVAFGATAETTVRPTAFRDLGQAQLNSGGIDRRNTLLAPAVTAAQRGRGRLGTDCGTRALVIVSDGIVTDDPADLATALRSGRFARVFLVTPGYWGRPAAFRAPELAGIDVKHFWNAERLGVLYADVIAEVSGQRVGHRR